ELGLALGERRVDLDLIELPARGSGAQPAREVHRVRAHPSRPQAVQARLVAAEVRQSELRHARDRAATVAVERPDQVEVLALVAAALAGRVAELEQACAEALVHLIPFVLIA